MILNNQTSRQFILDFPHRESLGREDFLVAECNAEAVSLIDCWPNWPYFGICIYGPEGCGKTHLANVFATNVARLTEHPYKVPVVRAEQLDIAYIRKSFEEHKCLIIENLEKLTAQETLFHIYNLYRDEGGNILFTSSTAPARLNITLPDLRSRLNILPAIEIKTPDNDLLSALLVKLFDDRQITPSPEVINYMLNNMQRSFSYARKLVEEIDNISLERKHAVTINIVKKAIASLASTAQGNLFY